MKYSFSLAASLACLITGTAHAANSTFTSTANVTVDTRDAATIVPTFSYLCFRTSASGVIENGSYGVDTDTPLKVKGTDTAALLRLPIVTNDHDGLPGVIADGVTPLLIVVSAPSNLATTRTYKITTQTSCATYSGGAIPLRVLANGAFSLSDRVTLSPSATRAFILVDPLDSDKIDHNPGGSGYQPLKVSLSLAEVGVDRSVAATQFKVRKPPVVLVHGFNADSSSWGDAFLATLKAHLGDDFVIPINYGTANGNKDANTYEEFKPLLAMLDTSLRDSVENEYPDSGWPQDAYAWTRYDVIGHSQGGVLLRFLCSSSASGGSLESQGFHFAPFRSDKNFNRGRFRRVLTIGSPHAGSTIAHLAIKMKEQKVGFNGLLPQLGKDYLDRLMQEKFMIDAPDDNSPRKKTARSIDAKLVPDPTAKMMFLGASIFWGLPPSATAGLPKVYDWLWLKTSAQYPANSGILWGTWIAPLGSDGVVDLRSQLAASITSIPQNSIAMPEDSNISHAGVPNWVSWLADVFGTSSTETNSSDVAVTAISLLDFYGNEFGCAPSFASTYAEMDAAAAAMSAPDGIIAGMAACFKASQRRNYSASLGAILSQSSKPMSSFSSGSGGIVPMSFSSSTMEFDLSPEADEPIAGNVTWAAQVYGPAGITTDGLTLTTTGTNASHLSLLIDAAVVGQVTLQATYPSTTGKTISGLEDVVSTRNTGNLTGIELRPGTLVLEPGTDVPLEVWGLFDAGSPCRLFLPAGDIAYQSSAPAIATVSADGRVSLLATGNATITATYQGSKTAGTQVTVLGPVPQITSASPVSAVSGVSLNYQITASGNPSGFSADNLPTGLSLNATTGLINGTPTANGTFTAQIGATNATGTGWKAVPFTVDPGSNLAPTDIGISATAIPANQPAGTVIGALSASDPNPADTTFAFALVAGTGADDNGIFAISGGNLTATAVINPATKSLCKIRVRCTDSGGLYFEKAFELPVLGAPVISSQPTDARGLAGSSLSLSVLADGIDPISYQWKRNGVDVPGATGSFVSISAGAATSGNWTVTVSNGFGTVTSNPAVVTADNPSFGMWANQNASWLGTKTAASDDPDGNGIPNLLKFAFAGNAYQSAPSCSILPQVVTEGNQCVFKYLKARDKAFTTFRVMRSQDLVSWQEFVPANGTVSVQAAPSPYTDSDIMRITIPTLLTSDFFRLEVTE